MSKATVSVLPVMPRIQGGLPCVSRLEPSMRLQQVNLQGLTKGQPPGKVLPGPSLRFVPLMRGFLR
jgi:hypothetical protein